MIIEISYDFFIIISITLSLDNYFWMGNVTFLAYLNSKITKSFFLFLLKLKYISDCLSICLNTNINKITNKIRIKTHLSLKIIKKTI